MQNEKIKRQIVTKLRIFPTFPIITDLKIGADLKVETDRFFSTTMKSQIGQQCT